MFTSTTRSTTATTPVVTGVGGVECDEAVEAEVTRSVSVTPGRAEVSPEEMRSLMAAQSEVRVGRRKYTGRAVCVLYVRRRLVPRTPRHVNANRRPGRTARRASASSSTSSADPGDSDADPEPAPLLVAVQLAATADAIIGSDRSPNPIDTAHPA